MSLNVKVEVATQYIQIDIIEREDGTLVLYEQAEQVSWVAMNLADKVYGRG